MTMGKYRAYFQKKDANCERNNIRELLKIIKTCYNKTPFNVVIFTDITHIHLVVYRDKFYSVGVGNWMDNRMTIPEIVKLIKY